MEVIQAVRNEVNKVVIGKEEVVDKVLTAMLAGGHILLEDIPGVGKTTMALSFARVLGMDFKRVQFTPDVLPSDIVGFGMYNGIDQEMEYKPGAVVCNLFLADEINRTSAKTQSALLEVMEEGIVTVDGISRVLPQPFTVIATQNPNGSVGTHNLPESQLDRFMIRLSMGYPDQENEIAILKGKTEKLAPEKLNTVITLEQFLVLKNMVNDVFVHDAIYRYIVNLSEQTRKDSALLMGLSPRGSIALCTMAKAKAFMEGRQYVLPEDVMNIFCDVAAHRVLLSPAARIEKKTAEEVLKKILASVKAPKVKA